MHNPEVSLKTLILSLIFTLCSFATAANLPMAFDAAKWAQLQTRIEKNGVAMETEAGVFMSLSHIDPADVTKAHQSDYMSLVGFNVNGKYTPYTVSTVSETWGINADGDWDVNQWIFDVSMQGELRQIYHIHLVESMNGTVKADDIYPPLSVSSPEALEQWDKIAAPWMNGQY